METHAVLVLGSIFMSCGCLGLIIVRVTNPFLKGLGWLGGAFAAGALGAFILTTRLNHDGLPSLLVSNALILLSFALLHICVLELTGSERRVPRLAVALLVLQAAADTLLQRAGDPRNLCVVILGLFVAAQALQSAARLKKAAKEGIEAPVWFCISLLASFAAFNICRGIFILLAGVPTDPNLPNPLEATSAIIFLAVGLGLGFGVFWITSAQIRAVLEGLANTDPLTGIYNRRSFVTVCEKELQRCARSGEQFSLLIFDIDHFKRVNDAYGHNAGDAVLCAVVERLRNAVRNIDVVGRWGGEEFVALLPRADCQAAMIVAQRLQQSVEALSVPASEMANIKGGVAISVTVSIGLATYFGQVETLAELLYQCDAAMYQAKAEGRNRIIANGPQYALFQ
jgi:diguanylate cyclase (GGDEF)-like protein